MHPSRPILTSLLVVLGLTACSGEDDPPPPPGEIRLALDFRRDDGPGLDPFTVFVSVTRGNDPLPGQTLEVTVDRGTATAVVDRGDGTYDFQVTPAGTGEHPLTVGLGDVEVSRTALVLEDVHAGWEQPLAVPGLVNTAGYEDGVTVTPDGEYVFVQTGPFHWSGIIVFLTPRDQGGAGGNRLVPTEFHHPWIDDLIGPYVAPERPGFFDGRFSGNRCLHNAASWGVGVNQAPNFAISTMIYGFKRQGDGTFAEPFHIAFEDENDALVTPYGLGIKMNGDGTARVVFSLDMPSDLDEAQVDVNGDGFGGADDVPSGIDLYTGEIDLDQDNILGHFTPSGTPGTPPRKDTPFSAVPVALGNTGTDGVYGTQGNVGYYESGTTILLFTDDEYDTGGDRGEIAVYVLESGTFPGGVWSKTILPSDVNTADEEIQPFFTGDGMYFTRLSGPEVWHAPYTGPLTAAGFADNANWGTPSKLLSRSASYTLGSCVAIGEPTACTWQGDDYLYFVYAVVRAIDDSAATTFYDLDFNAGFVRKR